MPTARYFIVQDREEWKIRYAGQEYGPYKSQNEAMIFAIDAAQKLRAYGETVEVCLRGDDGHYHPEWTAHRQAPEPRA